MNFFDSHGTMRLMEDYRPVFIYKMEWNMTPMHWVTVAVGVLIVCAMLIRARKWRRRKRIDQLLDESAGTFDVPAQAAFAAGDGYDKAEIIHMNVLEAEPTRNRALAGFVARAYLDEMNNPATEHDMADVVLRAGQFNDAIIGAGVLHDAQWQDYPADLMGLTINDIHTKTIKDTVAKAMQTADSGTDAAHAALASAVKWTDDRQNVHDTSVNNDLRQTLAFIRDPAVDAVRCLHEISAEIKRAGRSTEISTEKRARAEQALERAAHGDFISTYSSREDDILAAVWNRSKSATNDESSIKSAVVDALADCVEGGTLVCINGRCSRYLGALAGVDTNPAVGRAATAEAYKNEAFGDVQKVVDRVLDDARGSADKAMREAASRYDEFADGADLVKQELASRIDETVGGYSDKLSPTDLDYVKTAARAYALVDD